jgi:hypothetical protein
MCDQSDLIGTIIGGLGVHINLSAFGLNFFVTFLCPRRRDQAFQDLRVLRRMARACRL